jgi:hypothetical protein
MTHRYPPPPSPEELGLVPAGPAAPGRRLGDDLPKMSKFRFQLLAGWIADSFPPCTVADVGGGKGLLCHLLNQAGFQAEVVDPVDQPLPSRYRDLRSGRRVRLGGEVAVPRRRVRFGPGLGHRYDLLVALHAHGANRAVLDTVAAPGAPVWSCRAVWWGSRRRPPRAGAGSCGWSGGPGRWGWNRSSSPSTFAASTSASPSAVTGRQ